MCAKRTMALNGLKGRLRELAKKADCYEELKLNLVLEGWNLDDEKVKAAVRRWLTSFSSCYVCKCYFASILGLDEGISSETAARRSIVMRELWEDVVGVEDKAAAKASMLQIAYMMTSSYGWNAANAAKMLDSDADDIGLEAVNGLATWLGNVAWGRQTKAGS